MADFINTENEADFINQVRQVFRAYVPESDGWAKPNTFDVFSTVIGGLSWSSVNEARNGFDVRANPRTASGEYLDILAALPPLNLTRLGETNSTGFVNVNIPALTMIDQGFEFETAAGVTFIADEDTALNGGAGIIPVTSTSTGASQNSIAGQPLEFQGDGTATSMGIFGGNDIECDSSLRQRMFAERSSFHFFGSASSYVRALTGILDVSRAWAVEDGRSVKILFLQEGKYPCGVPMQEDIDAAIQYFSEDCRTNLFYCPYFEGATSLTIAPEIDWQTFPDDIAEVEASLQEWLRDNFGLGEGVEQCEIESFLRQTYPEFGPNITDCDDYPPVCNAVYNCVELQDQP